MSEQPTKSLSTIIQGVAASSILADSIVTRMSKYMSLSSLDTGTTESLQADIATLRQEIDRLNSLVTVLQNSTDDEEEQTGDSAVTDEQEQAFISSMNTTLNALTASELRFGYTKSLLSTYPRRLRFLVATVLVNICSTRKVTPEPIWQELVSKYGAL